MICTVVAKRPDFIVVEYSVAAKKFSQKRELESGRSTVV